MYTQYQYSDQFKIDFDSSRIRNIVLCRNAQAAELFLAKIFPIFNDCYVASADQLYPQNKDLNSEIFRLIAESPDVVVVIFDSNSLNQIKIRTERILVADRLIGDFYSRAKIRQSFRRSIDEFFIAHLLFSFFDQWNLKNHVGDSTHKYRSSAEYDRQEMGWLLDLIAPEKSNSVDAPITYEDENIEEMIFGNWRNSYR